MRILIVDDEEIVRSVIGQVLGGTGVEIVEAGSCAQALQAAHAGFDVALVDKNLPDGSGVRLIEELKRIEPLSESLLITAYASLESAIEAVRAGAFDYLLKPFPDINDILIKVRNAREKVQMMRERAAMTVRLIDSERRYRGLFEASSDPIIVYDRETETIEDVNQAACRLYGQARERLVGAPYDLVRGPATDSQPGRADRRADGGSVEVEVSSASFVVQGRTKMIDVIRDVTERRQLEARRRRLEEQLWKSQKMEALGRLAGNVAHDVNNALSVIMSSAEMAMSGLSRGLATDEIQVDLQSIERASQNAAEITRQLLLFARGQPFKRQPLELGQVVDRIRPVLARLVGPGARLRSEPADRTCWVEADAGQLEQILSNLVINARDACDSGGVIDIRLQRAGEQVVLEVIDNGSGIPPEVRERMFEPFFTTKPEGKGTGLGLSIVYGLVESLGGQIAAESEVGRGTCFRITLPITSLRRSQPLPQPAPPPVATHRHGCRVLLAEDDGVVREITRRALERAGYRVVEAVDGVDALAKARTDDDFDLLLTDVLMPQRSGPELARLLAELRGSVKVIFMSGFTPELEMDPGMASARFLSKPFSEAQLLALVREVMDAPE